MPPVLKTRTYRRGLGVAVAAGPGVGEAGRGVAVRAAGVGWSAAAAGGVVGSAVGAEAGGAGLARASGRPAFRTASPTTVTTRPANRIETASCHQRMLNDR